MKINGHELEISRNMVGIFVSMTMTALIICVCAALAKAPQLGGHSWVSLGYDSYKYEDKDAVCFVEFHGGISCMFKNAPVGMPAEDEDDGDDSKLATISHVRK